MQIQTRNLNIFQDPRNLKLKRIAQRIVLYGLMILAVFWAVFPLFWVLISSVTPDIETYSFERTFLPKNPTLDNYISLFKITPFAVWMRNSAVLSTVTTVVVVLLSSMTAYAMSRFRYKSFKIIAQLTLLAYMMPAIILVVPIFFLLFRLNLINSMLGLLLVYIGTRLSVGLWMLRSYFQGIPIELEEQSMVDGATRFQAFWKIILPQAFPGMISTAIFTFSVTWQEFLFASILIFNSRNQTVSGGVATFISEDWIYSWGTLMAAGVMISLPLVLLYAFMQKYLVAGWGGGAVKG
ncbi:MAG: carbohydrate ABC transporter permease [Anaerolineae bacterium]|nr:carbohydrate ABC transporter permease [Anaerolineae bacterium]